jgi:hypothetical protein
MSKAIRELRQIGHYTATVGVLEQFIKGYTDQLD